MKNLIFVFIALVIGFYSCNSNNSITDPGNNSSFSKIRTQYIPCDADQKTKSTLNKINNKFELFYWDYNNGYLDMIFKFNAVCESKFADSIYTNGSTMEIFLRDTSSIHAHCICDEEFHTSAMIENTSEVHLKFNIMSFTSDKYNTVLDTVLSIK